MRRLRLTPLRLAAALLALSFAGVGIAYAAGMSVTSGQVGAARQSLTKGSCQLGASAVSDTWIDERNPTQANSGDTTLQIQNNKNKVDNAFLRFDLGSCNVPTTGGADAATLTIVVTSATKTNHTVSLYPVTSSWSPSTLTWNAAQSLTIGSTPTDSFTTTTGAHTLTVTADLDAAIKAGTLWGWELVDTAGSKNSTTEIASSSYATSSYRPSLSLSYEK